MAGLPGRGRHREQVGDHVAGVAVTRWVHGGRAARCAGGPSVYALDIAEALAATATLIDADADADGAVPLVRGTARYGSLKQAGAGTSVGKVRPCSR